MDKTRHLMTIDSYHEAHSAKPTLPTRAQVDVQLGNIAN